MPMFREFPRRRRRRPSRHGVRHAGRSLIPNEPSPFAGGLAAGGGVVADVVELVDTLS
jgi:hypothetical protein